MSDQPHSENQAAAPAPRRHLGPAMIFAACIALIIFAAVLLLSPDRGYVRRVDPESDNAYVGGDVTQVSARIQGYVTSLPVADNQLVHAGDLIARIEDDDYRAERDQAQAALQAAGARLVAIEAQKSELQAQIGQVRSTEAGAIAAGGRTEPELARQRLLVHTDAGDSRALDEAVANHKRNLASTAAAHGQLLVREGQVDILDAQRRQAEAEIAARQADLDLARLNLGWTRIVAPIDGTLGARHVRVGDLVAPGTRIITVTPMDTVWVDANFTERQITAISVGQRATVRLDTFPGDVLRGRVVGISPVTGGRLSAVAPDNTTGNFTKVPARVPVRIAMVWPDSGRPARLRGLVRPGMSAIVTVLTGNGG